MAPATFLAFLEWTHTSHLTHCPLTSSFPTASHASRASFLDAHHSTNPSSLLPISPKFLQHLSDYLQILPLRKLALDSLESNLSVANAAHELFGPLPACFEDVHETLLAFMGRNWKGVDGSDGMAQVEKRIAEVPWGGVVARRLARRLRASGDGVD